ncbi:MAG: glycerol dehydrogenase [Halieaceae bacterium]|jgi:glycerol dehydrogenase|nr:glycerol dehydrogenase [Halieaceae bacterium]
MDDKQDIEFSALEPFAAPLDEIGTLPAVFGSPLRYVQGEGVIRQAGRYLSRLGIRRAAVLLSRRSQRAEGRDLLASLEAAGIAFELATFAGECSLEEITLHTRALQSLKEPVDAVIAVGGGKAVDAGKSIAHRCKLPSVVVPTLASNDAPCAAVSVLYTADGVTLDAEIFDENPVLVLMDTGVVARAGERYLVAGMGDAMATWYEARACIRNPAGFTVFGGRPTLAGNAIARLCADTIFEHGIEALAAVRAHKVTAALEQVVEANTLLSGLGYESGGLAAAHAFAQGFTVLDSVHRNYLHGEMVAMGTIAQLVLESAVDDAARVAGFFIDIGLPVHLGHLGLSVADTTELNAACEASLAFPFIANMGMQLDAQTLQAALSEADALGRGLVASKGDTAYRALHAPGPASRIS